MCRCWSHGRARVNEKVEIEGKELDTAGIKQCVVISYGHLPPIIRAMDRGGTIAKRLSLEATHQARWQRR